LGKWRTEAAMGTSFWHARRVLVTGCSGFLGGAVARELVAHGAEVVGLAQTPPPAGHFGPDPARVKVLNGRADNVFRLHSALAVHEISCVFHLAARDPFGEDRATPAVLQAMGMYSRRAPVVTARPFAPLGLAAHEPRDERASVARFGEVFGPGDCKPFRAVPALALGGPVRPGPARDFVFVSDAARALLLVAEAFPTDGASDYPFRSGWHLSDAQLAAAVRDASAGREPQVPDTAPPTNPLGWAPERTFGAALAEALAWYRGRADVRRAA
jgi:nucleoside-diphosphate-sugar epimerase